MAKASANDSGFQPTSVFVLGPESSGSKLVARIAARALEVEGCREWDGSAWCGGADLAGHRVYHRSLPYLDSQWPDVDAWIKGQGLSHQLRFVLTTRDRTISEFSRTQRFSKAADLVRAETNKAVETMTSLLAGPHPTLVYSYESFMLLGAAYRDLLLEFLGAPDAQHPLDEPLRDGNEARIVELTQHEIRHSNE